VAVAPARPSSHRLWGDRIFLADYHTGGADLSLWHLRRCRRLAAILAAFNLSGQAGPRWWLGLSGVVSIVAGIVAFIYTGMTALVLLVFIAVWAIIIGVLQLYAAIQLWKVVDNDWWLILSGLLSIAFGAVLIAWPGTGALALIWTIAWFALFFGCMFIGLAFELKKFKRT
jgi:uncharacterized membrane protein HdeD (DUF308 family)